MKRIAIGGLLLAASMVSAQQVELSIPEPDTVRLDWQAIPGQTYRVLRASNLTDAAWSDSVPGGVVAPNVTGNHQEPRTGKAAFFRIVKEDTDPPAVVSLSPANEAVAVLSNATVTVALSDETGIDETSIRLSVAGWEEMTTANPSITYADGTLVFTPPDALGAAGETITNRLTVADTLGHALTNYTWSFTLERNTEASSDFLPLTAPPEALIAPLAAGGYFRRSVPEIQPLNGVDEYHIVSVTSNTVIFSYSGAFPVIGNGTKLVSFDAAYPMYRIVSEDAFMVNPVLQQITVTTTNLALTALVSEGSLSGLDLTPVVLGGAQSLRTLGDLKLLHVEYGNDLSGEVLYNEGGVKLWLPSASWSFTGDVDVSLELFWAQLQSLEVAVSGNLSMNLSPEAIFYQAVSGDGETPLVAPVTHLFGAMLGPVPVWVEVVMELNAGYEYSASVSGNASTTVDASKDLNFTLRLHDNQWSHELVNPPPVLDCEPIDWALNGEANAKVYVQPKLTVLVYSLAGPWLDVKPYVELDGWAQANPAAGELGLYYGLSSTLGIESRIWYSGWGEKPEWELFNVRQPLWYDRYPDDSAPTFAAGFPNRTVSQGQSLTLSGHATGYPIPLYRWYFNGARIIGATGPTYTIASANSGHQGTYTVQAYNSLGSVQASCYVTVGSSAPTGMVLIPGGTNSGTDPDFGAYSLTVNSFFMDRYEVTKAKWDEVYTWAIANGYGFDNAGSGKAANHPVHTVNWYDVVKWCNARSQKEGRPAVYTVGGAVYKTGQSDNVVQTSAAGYRLPTDVEWEYAARGGVANRRFPWGDSDFIDHSRANYYSYWSGGAPYYSYDKATSSGYHPTYNDGTSPYTSSAGSFAANGYGLYDMTGNVWEWCFDRYPGYEGSNRVIRGGGWDDYAYFCRVGNRYNRWPGGAGSYIGFRAVLPPGQ